MLVHFTGEEGPAVEVPLDGTVYDLETGKVIGLLHLNLMNTQSCTLCPQNSCRHLQPCTATTKSMVGYIHQALGLFSITSSQQETEV